MKPGKWRSDSAFCLDFDEDQSFLFNLGDESNQMKHIVRKIYNQITSSRRNKVLDQEMLAVSVSLSSKHLECCKVYPDRISLISGFPKNAVIAEVGVAQGDLSAEILKVVEPRLFYLIDAWAMKNHPHYGEGGYERVKERFDDEIKSRRIQIKRGYSDEVLKGFDNNSLDWIYIDAAHDYYSVKNDLDIAYIKVKNGGIISGHDYHRWGKNGKRFGVLEAVNDFCVQKELFFIGLSLENDLNWSYALRAVK